MIEILKLQEAGHSEKGRRERASHVIEALADKVARKEGAGLMRLLRAKIENFKLLENVSIVFHEPAATAHRHQSGERVRQDVPSLRSPLGVLWMAGLPVRAQGLYGTTSSAVPSGIPVLISVMIEFDHHDDAGEVAHYRLIRSVTETPGDGDKVDLQQERLRLLRIAAAGEEGVANAEAVIGKRSPCDSA